MPQKEERPFYIGYRQALPALARHTRRHAIGLYRRNRQSLALAQEPFAASREYGQPQAIVGRIVAKPPPVEGSPAGRYRWRRLVKAPRLVPDAHGAAVTRPTRQRRCSRWIRLLLTPERRPAVPQRAGAFELRGEIVDPNAGHDEPGRRQDPSRLRGAPPERRPTPLLAIRTAPRAI
jgi:hypothetical protein